VKPYRADMQWLLVGQTPTGGYVVEDTRTGERIEACCLEMVHQIAADRSGETTHLGLGDLFHRAAKWLGFRRCAGCAKRHTALNRAAPKLWRK
jgi:hypothetical protein